MNNENSNKIKRSVSQSLIYIRQNNSDVGDIPPLNENSEIRNAENGKEVSKNTLFINVSMLTPPVSEEVNDRN